MFRRIQLAQPDQPAWARLEMANAELFGGSASEAVVVFESLMSDGDLREPILTRRALALRRSSRREDAAEAYRETLAYYPDSETAALGIIECFLDRRRVTEAHTFIATWSEGRPRSAQILAWRGWLLARLQRFDEANNLLGAIPAAAFDAQSIMVGRAIRERFQGETPLPMVEARQPSLVIEPTIESLPISMPGVETGRPLTRQAQLLAAEGVAVARAGSTQLDSAQFDSRNRKGAATSGLATTPSWILELRPPTRKRWGGILQNVLCQRPHGALGYSTPNEFANRVLPVALG